MILDIEINKIRLTNLRLNLVGTHQINNACIAVLLVLEWIKHQRSNISHVQLIEGIRNGFEKLDWPGRCKKIHTKPDVYIDVGHSPGAVESYVNTMKKLLHHRNVLLVTGVSYDKDVQGIISKLLPIADEVICTRAYHKGSKVTDIEAAVKKVNPGIPTLPAKTIEKAVEMAMDIAARKNMVVMIGGGLFLSIEAQLALQGEDPRSLRFF